MSFLLIILVLLPIVGAVLCALLPSTPSNPSTGVRGGGPARVLALVVALATLAVGLVLAGRMDLGNAAAEVSGSGGVSLEQLQKTVQITHTIEMLSPAALSGFSFKLGLDTVSLWMVLLTGLLFPLTILASFGFVRERENAYYAWMLLLLGSILGVFLARDVLLFYVFFELTLVPSFFLIGGWGGNERRIAAMKFVVYTFAGSVLMLAGLIYVGLQAGTFDLILFAQAAQQIATGSNTSSLILLALLAGFAVKAAVFPLHSWLVGSYTEAPAPVAAILSGVLAKLGTYGFIRLVIPCGMVNSGLADNINHPYIQTGLAVLATLGILYGALLAYHQTDAKRVLAFSSLSHMGLIVLALLSVSLVGHQGGFLYMVNHGISTGALFLMVGMLEQRLSSRNLTHISGLGKTMPVFSFFFVLFAMSSIALPGTNGFISDFLCLFAAFNSKTYSGILGVLAAGVVVLGAVYMLTLVAKLLFGEFKVPEGVEPAQASDLNTREVTLLLPLAVLVIVLGFAPGIILDSVKLPLELSISQIEQHSEEVTSTFSPAQLTPDRP